MFHQPHVDMCFAVRLPAPLRGRASGIVFGREKLRPGKAGEEQGKRLTPRCRICGRAPRLRGKIEVAFLGFSLLEPALLVRRSYVGRFVVTVQLEAALDIFSAAASSLTFA
jgi:hypothetical protein